MVPIHQSRLISIVALVAISPSIPTAHAFQPNNRRNAYYDFSSDVFVPGRRRLQQTHLLDATPDSVYTTREHDVSGHKLILDTTSNRKREEIKVGSPDLSLDPALLEIVPRCDSLIHDEDEEEVCLLDTTARSRYKFVNMLRMSAPYIANHRGELAVLHIPGSLLSWQGFADLMDDIAQCWLLGMKIVIVAGCRHQVDDRLEKENFDFDKNKNGHIRITDSDHLRVIEEEAGFVRFEVERQLNRCLRLHGGGDVVSNEPGRPPAPNGNVVSGNFFSASPFGVVDGVDYQCTGRPKHLNVRRICDLVQNGDIVLLTPIGVGPTGEGMNVKSESLAAFVASSLCANKVVYCSDHGMVLRNKETKKKLQNFRVRDAQALLEHFQLEVRQNYFVTLENSEEMTSEAAEMLLKVGWATRALQDGVERAHIIAPTNGALIEELFTAKEGTGTCISHDSFQSIHPDDDSGDNDTANHRRDYRQEFAHAFDHAPDWPRHSVPRDFPWK